MKKNAGVVMGLFFIILVSMLYIIKIIKEPTLKHVNGSKFYEQCYEQGILDGFNRRINQKDTVHINIREISKINSVLYSK